MLKIYDKISPITWPNGKTYTVDDLKADKDYAGFFNVDFVIDETDGVVFSYQTLAQLKASCNVTTADPQAALEECKAVIEQRKQQAEQQASSLEEVSAKTDENTQALGELGTMVADGQTANADLLQAVGELGVQVAELSAKIEQLQTPTA